MGVSKILKRRAFTKLGLLFALFVGVGVSTLLVIVDGNFVKSWPEWLATNHWFMSVVRVGLFIAAITTFYLVRSHSILRNDCSVATAERTQLNARVRHLLLWFVSFEILFGQALLPRTLEFFFS